jgi:polyisoprenoid-binding protein YceI
MEESMPRAKPAVQQCRSILLILLSSVALAADADVAGKWTVSAKNGRHSVTQALVLEQKGGKVTGTFTGPRQSGTIDGTVSGNAIKLHVTAKMPIDYTGTVDGDSMKGTLTSEGKSGEWTGTRTH